MKKKNIIYTFLNKTLITVFITILLLVIIKANPSIKEKLYYHVYEDSISFAAINNEYKKLFGSTIPFIDYFTSQETVFNEKIKYDEINKYKDGAKLSVGKEYLIPNQEQGIVIFIGEKEDYGNTIIVQQSNGVDVWYGNIKNASIKLYDYIEKGKYIGVCDDNLYIVYKKEGKVIDYNEYL